MSILAWNLAVCMRGTVEMILTAVEGETTILAWKKDTRRLMAALAGFLHPDLLRRA